MKTHGEISGTRVARCLLFLALSFFISWLAQDGRLSKLVHPRMNPWIEGSGLVFLLMAFVQLRFLGRKPRSSDPLNFFIPILFVIAIAFIFITSKALSSGSLNSDADALAAANAIIVKRDKAQGQASAAALPSTIVFDDDRYWTLYNRLYDDPKAASGHTVVIKGYFHGQKDYPGATGLVARDLMWCCSADMSRVGLLAQGSAMQNFGEGSWLEVTGRLSSMDYDFGGRGKATRIPLLLVDAAREVPKGDTSGVVFPF